MAKSRFTPQERWVLRSGIAQTSRMHYREHGYTIDQIGAAEIALGEAREGLRAFRNLSLLGNTLFLAASKINSGSRDIDGDLTTDNRNRMNHARQFAGQLRQWSIRLDGLDSGPYSPLQQVVDDARDGVKIAKTNADAISWQSYNHYRQHRTEYVAMAIIEMTDAGIEHVPPRLPEGVDPSDPMAVAAFVMHASDVHILPSSIDTHLPT